MKIKDFFKKELNGFSTFEKIFFPLELVLIIILSFLTGDDKIALISAIAGISYTILAGMGKISCYFIGITGTFCYCYIAYKNAYFGNLLLYGAYFFPMQILGIFKWAKHRKKDTGDIIKTHLSKKERIVYGLSCGVLAILFGFILMFFKGQNPFMDSTAAIFSIFGQILTVKRCIEQWYIWLFVNILTFIMWVLAYLNGSNCLATIIMWGTYIFLALYFLRKWKKEIFISNKDKT